MNRILAPLACLVLATSLLAACKGGKETAPAGTTAAPSAQGTAPVAAEITGAGATFIYPLLSKWSDTYHTQTGHKINYQSIGSGGGIAQIKAATVDFGASDKPLSSAELQQFGGRTYGAGSTTPSTVIEERRDI